MALSTQHQFIFGVILMYGFIFMIYSLSGGASGILAGNNGLSGTSVFEPTAPNTGSITDLLIGALSTVTSFFVLMFATPLFNSTLWFIAPINWAILGTTIYLFIRILRGGG